jgi:hypothetical protein
MACFAARRTPHAARRSLPRGYRADAALERLLRVRAARGGDIGFVAPGERATATPTAPANQSSAGAIGRDARGAEGGAVASPWLEKSRTARADTAGTRSAGARRPLSRTLVDSCLDLAVVPGLCAGPFWNELFDSIRLRGGSFATLMQKKTRRQEPDG